MNDNHEISLKKSDPFKFEATGAPISIMAAKWSGNNPEKTFISFYNEKFLENYQDHRDRLFIDFLNALTVNNKGSLFLESEAANGSLFAS